MPTPSFHRRDWFIALGLGLLLIVLGYSRMVVGVCGIYHDDAVYVSTARSLAEGRGYHLINLPDAPLQTKYPILYPALLALIWKLWPSFPDNLAAMQWLTLITGAAAIALAYLYLIRCQYFSRGVAVAAALLCTTSSPFLFFCSLTLSEMSFALLFILALWTLDRQMANSDERWSAQFFVGVALALPFLSRTIGVVFAPLGVALLFSYKRPWCLTALGSASIMLPWVLWMLLVPNWHDTGVETYYTNYLSWWSALGIPHLSKVIIANILFTIVGGASTGLGVFNSSFYFPAKAWPFIAFIGILGFVSLIRHLRTGRALPSLLVGYLLVILVWPWPPARFLIPVLPFLLAYILNPMWKLVEKFSFVVRPKVLATFGAITLVALNLSIERQAASISQGMGYPVLRPLEEPVAWSSYEEVFRWIRENTAPTDVIASGLDTMVYLYTGRCGFRPFVGRPRAMFYGDKTPPLGSAEEMILFIKVYKATHFVQVPMPGFREEEPLIEFIQHVKVRYPGWLKPVYVGRDSRYVVYKLQPEWEPSPGQSDLPD